MAWILLVAAGLLEIAWSSALKKSDGLRRFGWSAAGIGLALVSLGLLTFALRDLPVGTAYAVWVGVGAVGVAIAGVLVHDESLTPARFLSLAATVVGIAGLKLFGG